MNHPDGRLESAKISGRTATVTGWALDPGNPATATSVQITDNGRAVAGWTTTTVNRADINSALGVVGTHGFQLNVPLTRGSHRLCSAAAAVTPGRTATTTAGCVTITVN